MLNSKESNRRSDKNEADVKEQFEKLGYSVKKLDPKSSKRPRPDFLISNSSGRQMLCEVKTVDSGGYPKDKSIHDVEYVHISTQDDELRGQFSNIPIDRSKIDNGLADAVRKRKALVEDDSRFAELPLLVAFFFDQLAEYLPFYPRTFGQHLQTPSDELAFREVSGILTIKENVARNKAFAKLSDEEQRRRLRTEALHLDCGHTPSPASMDDLPPRSKDFVLVKNEAALRVVPKDFERQCLPDADYE